MIPPEERPTAEALKAQANGGDPWACPSCGCRDMRREKDSTVESTRHPKDPVIRRRRICRHCGKYSLRTEETPVPEGHRLVIVPIDDGERGAA